MAASVMQVDLQDSLLVINEGKKEIIEWFDFGQIFLCFTAISGEPDLTSGLDGDLERSGGGNIFSDIAGFALRPRSAFSL